MRRILRFILTGLLALIASAPAASAAVEQLSFSDLCALSGRIFSGKVDSLWVTLEESGRMPVTHVAFDSVSGIKGTSEGRVVLNLGGGRFDGRNVELEGQPTFVRGGRYIVFCSADLGSARNMYVPITGLFQGFFPLSPEGGWHVLQGGRRVKEEKFVARIRARVKALH